MKILHASQLGSAGEYPVLVVPGLYITSDETLDWLRGYAEAGGHLVLGPRTGYADLEARARRDRMPARLSEAAGVWYDEFSNLMEPVRVDGVGGFEPPPGATATRWADGLVPDGAEVLARYRHPHFGQWAAITTRPVGKGRITYSGTVPGHSLAQAVLRWAVGRRSAGLPASVTSTGATSADGRRLRFLHNWSWEVVGVAADADYTDVLTGKDIMQGDAIEMTAWDVRVLLTRLAV